MKKIIFISLLMFLSFVSVSQNTINDTIPIINCEDISMYDNPIDQAKDIINKYPVFSNSTYKHAIYGVYKIGGYIVMNTPVTYFLLESPELCTDMIKSNYLNTVVNISTDAIFEIIERSIKTPNKVCESIAKNTITRNYNDYLVVYKIANNYLKTGELTEEDALTFLDKRWCLAKMNIARTLYNMSTKTPYSNMDAAIENYTINECKDLIDNSLSVPVLKAADIVNRFYNILQEKNMGLAYYYPYNVFENAINKINECRLAEKNKWKHNDNFILLNDKYIGTYINKKDPKEKIIIRKKDEKFYIDGTGELTYNDVPINPSPVPNEYPYIIYLDENNVSEDISFGGGHWEYFFYFNENERGEIYLLRALWLPPFDTGDDFYTNPDEVFIKQNKENISSTKNKTGYFTDSRDGKTYKWVKIGSQIWMAEDLAYSAKNGAMAYNVINNDGYSYNLKTAQNVCPVGWHLPALIEWEELSDNLITNYNKANINIFYISSNKWWWTSEYDYSGHGMRCGICVDGEVGTDVVGKPNDYLNSVRCIKDK